MPDLEFVNAYQRLAYETDIDYAYGFLWNETSYPFGQAKDISDELRAEAGRVRMEAMLS